MLTEKELKAEINERLGDVKKKHARLTVTKVVMGLMGLFFACGALNACKTVKEAGWPAAVKDIMTLTFIGGIAYGINQFRKNDLMNDENEAIARVLAENTVYFPEEGQYFQAMRKGIFCMTSTFACGMSMGLIPYEPQNIGLSALTLISGMEYGRRRAVSARKILDNAVGQEIQRQRNAYCNLR